MSAQEPARTGRLWLLVSTRALTRCRHLEGGAPDPGHERVRGAPGIPRGQGVPGAGRALPGAGALPFARGDGQARLWAWRVPVLHPSLAASGGPAAGLALPAAGV